MSEVNPLVEKLAENIESAIIGKPEAVRLALVALIGEGHLLIEDAPGVGKTSLAKAIAKSINSGFTRLQFTPDMLPSDILGSSVFLPNKGEFEFRRGPIFTNVLLADEINRTTPRTQSALLEAMNEGQVSIEGDHSPPCSAVLRTRHAESVRVRRNVSPAGKPARPIHALHFDRLSGTQRRAGTFSNCTAAASQSISYSRCSSLRNSKVCNRQLVTCRLKIRSATTYWPS